MACTFDENYPRTYGNKRGPYILIPPTTDDCLVFSYDRKDNKFDKSFYSPALTHGRVSYQQLESFLGEAERILKKKIAPVKKALTIFSCFAILGAVSLVFLMFSMISDDLDYDYDSEVTITNDDDFDEFESLLFVIFAYMFGVIFYGIIFNLYSRKRYRKARKSIQALADKKIPNICCSRNQMECTQVFPQMD